MGKGPRNPPFSAAWWKRRAAEIVGSILLVLGVLAIFLPGPGLLTTFAGLALLSTSFDWADRLMHPIKARAFQLAFHSVDTWPRIIMSVMGSFMMMSVGILWGLDFAVPGWWPIDDGWWLFGGWATGVTIMVSGAFALGLIIYSFIQFRLRGHLLPDEYRPDNRSVRPRGR